MLRELFRLLRSWFFKILWFFDLGRSVANRFLGFLPEVAMVLLYLDNRGIEINITAQYWFVIVLVFGFLFVGFMYKRIGFYDEEVIRNTKQTALAQEQLDKIRETNKIIKEMKTLWEKLKKKRKK